MRVLLDESLPRRLKQELPEHNVTAVPEAGWAGTKNGDLLRLAEPDSEVFVTMDR
jgi:predicted nuclease of predicted toxin-antitoxin system